MNCANHPDLPVAAFCQNCGKPLCTACVRSVSGIIYCEPCLAARLGVGGTYAAPGATAGPGAPASGFTPVDPNLAGFAPGFVPPPNQGPNPGTAFALGFIPGVGAMYNGQFVKAMVHVLVFVILIGITDNHSIFLIFVFAWIAYQVFDAFQTAKARREGLPLPDPFGLNELGAKFSISGHRPEQYPPASAYQPYTPVSPTVPPPASAGPSAGFTDSFPNQPYTAVPPVDPSAPGAYPGTPYPGSSYPGAAPFTPVPPQPAQRREPIGAIVLIGLGVLFLLNTLDFFRFDWLGHLWPLFIIALGAWMLIRRNAGTTFSRKDKYDDTPTPPPAGGAQ